MIKFNNICEDIGKERVMYCDSKYFYGNYKNYIDDLVNSTELVDAIELSNESLFLFPSYYFWNLYLMGLTINISLN